MNNNRDNYAVANAFDMARLLEISLPEPPAPIFGWTSMSCNGWASCTQGPRHVIPCW